ncbi:hypothetical protein CONLIGDRAFT_712705 [Coniochaeta ligniaria NRRL 30616]|uniref:SnoaL-like domain-containing protein n=1 Tax=Coniochaeta ligniaria NRRL 30616 TaxID=1408157 RepID=A0A1J7IXD0_9PEZI|nr:hypothetical protein CONLIGDRAFT_712705 [Coniochaeta ligniaria NRRL 30616]
MPKLVTSIMSESSTTTQVADHIKSRYTAYYHTADPDAKGLFYSADCMQICRPIPSYAAKDGATIVRYLQESLKNGQSMNNAADGLEPGSTIRPLRDDEFMFESDDVVAPIGYTSAELKQKAEKEEWVGTRVDLWFPVPDGSEMLCKVHYWWRKEGDEWVQILHDIMYIGPRDGSEGTAGENID